MDKDHSVDDYEWKHARDSLYDPDIAKNAEAILKLSDEHLKDVLAYKKDSTNEVRLAFRDLNVHSRSNYGDFIKKAGRNIYPLLIVSEYDYDNDFGSGAGNTFTLYLEDGQEFRMTPAANTGYAIYKSVSHVILGIGATIGPYMKNPETGAWIKPLMSYKDSIQRALSSLDVDSNRFTYKIDKNSVEQLLQNSLNFVEKCLNDKTFSFEGWQSFNKSNFSLITRCIELAVKNQSEANVEALLKWKKMLGPELWREMYVFVPTLWPVSRNNPRIELLRNLMDEDRVHTHLFASEWPRNENECRTMLGRIVGDRAIGRFVFGDDSCKARTKVISLSTEMDFVQDDFRVALKEAFKKNGIVPRENVAQDDKKKNGMCPMEFIKGKELIG